MNCAKNLQKINKSLGILTSIGNNNKSENELLLSMSSGTSFSNDYDFTELQETVSKNINMHL